MKCTICYSNNSIEYPEVGSRYAIYANYMKLMCDILNESCKVIPFPNDEYLEYVKREMDDILNELSEIRRQVIVLKYGLENDMPMNLTRISLFLNKGNGTISIAAREGMNYLKNDNNIEKIRKLKECNSPLTSKEVYLQLLLDDFKQYLQDRKKSKYINKYLKNNKIKIEILDNLKHIEPILQKKQMKSFDLNRNIVSWLHTCGVNTVYDYMCFKEKHKLEMIEKQYNSAKYGFDKIENYISVVKKECGFITIHLKYSDYKTTYKFYSNDIDMVYKDILEDLLSREPVVLDEFLSDEIKMVAMMNGWITSKDYKKNRAEVTALANNYYPKNAINKITKNQKEYINSYQYMIFDNSEDFTLEKLQEEVGIEQYLSYRNLYLKESVQYMLNEKNVIQEIIQYFPKNTKLTYFALFQFLEEKGYKPYISKGLENSLKDKGYVITSSKGNIINDIVDYIVKNEEAALDVIDLLKKEMIGKKEALKISKMVQKKLSSQDHKYIKDIQVYMCELDLNDYCESRNSITHRKLKQIVVENNVMDRIGYFIDITYKNNYLTLEDKYFMQLAHQIDFSTFNEDIELREVIGTQEDLQIFSKAFKRLNKNRIAQIKKNKEKFFACYAMNSGFNEIISIGL